LFRLAAAPGWGRPGTGVPPQTGRPQRAGDARRDGRHPRRGRRGRPVRTAVRAGAAHRRRGDDGRWGSAAPPPRRWPALPPYTPGGV